jgi:hypothetical protein
MRSSSELGGGGPHGRSGGCLLVPPKAVATALVDRWEHTKRYTEAEGRALEALSKVLDRIMPYEHRKLSAGDTPEHPHHVNVDLSGSGASRDFIIASGNA